MIYADDRTDVSKDHHDGVAAGWWGWFAQFTAKF